MAVREEKRLSPAPLKRKITRYFNDCADSGVPATPAGLALALDMRTNALTSSTLPPECRRIIDQALQRIEASTMELALTKAASKGVEVVLQHTDAAPVDAAMQALSDEELSERLERLAQRLSDWSFAAPGSSS